MPSNKPKVFAYLPQALYNQVEVYKTERGLNSDSQALIAILSEYFGSEIIDHAKSNNAIERLEILLNQHQIKAESSIRECDRRISALEVRWNLETKTNPAYTIEVPAEAIKETIRSVPGELEETINSVPGELEETINSVPGELEETINSVLGELEQGLSQRALSKRLGCSHPYIGKKEQEDSFRSLSASLDPQGISWELRGNKYYPCTAQKQETNLSATTEEDLSPLVIYAFDTEAKQYYYWEGLGRNKRGFGNMMPHALKYKSKATAHRSLEGICQSKDNSLFAYLMDADRVKLGIDSENFLRDNRWTGITRET